MRETGSAPGADADGRRHQLRHGDGARRPGSARSASPGAIIRSRPWRRPGRRPSSSASRICSSWCRRAPGEALLPDGRGRARRTTGHRVLLDGRPLRTPAKRLLALPSAALAEALAGEWRAQGEIVQPQAMPLTRLASTAQDRMPGAARRRDRGGGRLCRHRPPVLPRRSTRSTWSSASSRVWQPLLEWAASVYGARLSADHLAAAGGAARRRHPRPARGGRAASPTGRWSACTRRPPRSARWSSASRWPRGRIDAEQALAASLLDELFEIERWGQDAETERRHDGAPARRRGGHAVPRPAGPALPRRLAPGDRTRA